MYCFKIYEDSWTIAGVQVNIRKSVNIVVQWLELLQFESWPYQLPCNMDLMVFHLSMKMVHNTLKLAELFPFFPNTLFIIILPLVF